MNINLLPRLRTVVKTTNASGTEIVWDLCLLYDPGTAPVYYYPDGSGYPGSGADWEIVWARPRTYTYLDAGLPHKGIYRNAPEVDFSNGKHKRLYQFIDSALEDVYVRSGIA